MAEPAQNSSPAHGLAQIDVLFHEAEDELAKKGVSNVSEATILLVGFGHLGRKIDLMNARMEVLARHISEQIELVRTENAMRKGNVPLATTFGGTLGAAFIAGLAAIGRVLGWW